MDTHKYRQGPILSIEKMRAMDEGERFRRQEWARMNGLSQVEPSACNFCRLPEADSVHEETDG